MSYILNIKLKNINQKISRQVKIPENITAKQLAKVLILSFGWSGNYIYEIFFENNKLIITNDKNIVKKENNCDEYKVKSTDKLRTINLSGYSEEPQQDEDEILFIGETSLNLCDLLSKEQKLKFIYDFSDNWEHSVSIKQCNDIITKPEIISFVGDCPPEDCGGAESFNNFYEMMKILEKDGTDFDWGYGIKQEKFNLKQAQENINKYFL